MYSVHKFRLLRRDYISKHNITECHWGGLVPVYTAASKILQSFIFNAVAFAFPSVEGNNAPLHKSCFKILMEVFTFWVFFELTLVQGCMSSDGLLSDAAGKANALNPRVRHSTDSWHYLLHIYHFDCVLLVFNLIVFICFLFIRGTLQAYPSTFLQK